MTRRLSENDWKRIAEFADTPRHRRDPDQLVPQGDEQPEASD